MRKIIFTITTSLMAIGALAQSEDFSYDRWLYKREAMDGATVDSWSRLATLQSSQKGGIFHETMAHSTADGGDLLESSITIIPSEPLPSDHFKLTFTDRDTGKKKSVDFAIYAEYARQGTLCIRRKASPAACA